DRRAWRVKANPEDVGGYLGGRRLQKKFSWQQTSEKLPTQPIRPGTRENESWTTLSYLLIAIWGSSLLQEGLRELGPGTTCPSICREALARREPAVGADALTALLGKATTGRLRPANQLRATCTGTGRRRAGPRGQNRARHLRPRTAWMGYRYPLQA